MLRQPVRRVVRGTLTQWNRLFRGAGRHSDLVTVRRRSQGDAGGGRGGRLSAIGSRVSSLLRLAWCSALCSHSYIFSACLSISSLCFSPPSASWFNFQSGHPALKEIHCPRSRQRLRCWNGIGLDKQEQNKILVTSLPHPVSAGFKLCDQQLVKQPKCSSSCLRWWACYCVACTGHGPVKAVISFSLNNAASDRAVLWARCKTQMSKWLVCFEKPSFWRQPGRGLPSLFKHSKLLAPVVWGINVNTLQDQEFTLNS